MEIEIPEKWVISEEISLQKAVIHEKLYCIIFLPKKTFPMQKRRSASNENNGKQTAFSNLICIMLISSLIGNFLKLSLSFL